MDEGEGKGRVRKGKEMMDRKGKRKGMTKTEGQHLDSRR